MTGYKHRIIDKFINKFYILFTKSKLHTFFFAFVTQATVTPSKIFK